MRLLWAAFLALVRWIVQAPVRFSRWVAGFPRLVAWFKDGANRKEAWGYGWWGAAGIVIAVPELWAAVGGKDVLWPTISGTVGRLEVAHAWVALVVVGVLVWAAVHAIRVTTEKWRTSTGGPTLVAGVERYTVADDTSDVNPIEYLVFAVLAVAVPSALVRELYNGANDRYVFGEVMYALIAFWWLIVPGWLAYRRGYLVPYPTLFRTFKDLAGRAPRFTIILVGGLLILLVHLISYPWPATIPDTNRLHLQYECHPLQPPSTPPGADQKAACKKLDDADLKPPAATP